MTHPGSPLVRLLSVVTIILVSFVVGVTNADELARTKVPAESMAGAWQGMLKVGDVSIRLVINLTEKTPETWTGTLDAPDSGRKGIPIDEVAIKHGYLDLKLKSVPASFEGKLNKEWSEAKGTWRQGGQSFSVTFQRLAKAAEVKLKRPQEPKRPYPYAEEEVVFDNKTDAVQLAGTLTLPKGDGPFPAVVLITGSGPQDRDETLFGHRPFLVLADYLTRRGIAVLRVDDRGVGKSTGDLNKATVEDFAKDAFAGLQYLTGRKEIDGKRIGLIGHSEGGTVASLLASRSTEVAFVVLMAGPGLKGDELWYSQTALMLKVAGASKQQVERYRQVQEQLVAIIQRETNDKAAEKELRRVLDTHFASLSAEEKKAVGDFGALADAQVKNMISPSFRFNLAYDPKPTLLKVQCPVLAMNGEKDIVVACVDNLSAVEAALTAGGNKRYTTKALPKLNHFFQTCETGSFGECAKIEETLAPIALKLIGDWIGKQTK